MSPQESLEGRVVGIIRRDLMLGDDIVLTPNQPLFGGELDLDSLDALLLIQSLEVEFGFKMPNDSFEPSVFNSVATLARFVEEHRAAR
jgi:acyl carrier protein